MTATITTFRQAIASGLATQLGIAFVAGKLEGPQQRDIGCVFPDAIAETSGRVLEETMVVKARVFKAKPVQAAIEAPPDPSELEALSDQVQTWAAAHQTGLGPWFCRCVSVQFDVVQWGLEAVFIGTSTNESLL